MDSTYPMDSRALEDNPSPTPSTTPRWKGTVVYEADSPPPSVFPEEHGFTSRKFGYVCGWLFKLINFSIGGDDNEDYQQCRYLRKHDDRFDLPFRSKEEEVANKKDNKKLTSQFQRLANIWLCRHFSDPTCPSCFPLPLVEGCTVAAPFPKVKKEFSFFKSFTLPLEVLNSNRCPHGMANAIVAVLSNLLVKKKEEVVVVKVEVEEKKEELLQSPTSPPPVPKGAGPLAPPPSTDCSCPLSHRRDALSVVLYKKVDPNIVG